MAQRQTIYGDDVPEFWDYLEEVQIAIVFSYKAVESLCNALIPSDYVYELKDSRGVVQLFGKDQIERWITTSDKVTKTRARSNALTAFGSSPSPSRPARCNACWARSGSRGIGRCTARTTRGVRTATS